jgi:flagellar biosynthesis chaperone FliJ
MERRSELNSSRKLLDEAQQVTEKVQAEVSQGRKSSESASAQLRKVEEEKNEYQEQLRKNLITALDIHLRRRLKRQKGVMFMRVGGA